MRLFLLCFRIDPNLPFEYGNITHYGGIRDESGLEELRNMAPQVNGSFIVELTPIEGVNGWIVQEMDIRPKIEKLIHDDDIMAMVPENTDKINEIIDHINRGLDR